jgi:S-formylglutathione hydrolase FrmB
MDAALAAVSVTSGWLPALVDAASLVLLIVILARRTRRRTVLATLAAALLGAGAGLFLCWLLSDRLDLFDVSLSPVSRAWVAAAFGAVGVAGVGLFRRGGWRRAAAVAVIPLALLAGAIGVNADFGQYPTIGSLDGRAVATAIPTSVLASQRAHAPGESTRQVGPSDQEATATALWSRPPVSGRPDHGIVGTVTIPATTSHFDARSAYLYLPPAALVANPPALPVLILLSGQPGGPSNMVQSGKVKNAFDAFAAAHHGLAPIVVVPDQLGEPQLNPMCVDSALGDVGTYLTVDVPNWIRTHLTVQTTPAAWAIGGFSEGGTCSIQLGGGHPELFGGIFDISGQLAPANGTVAQTIERGFGGSRAAYTAALPLSLLAAHAPYANTVAVFVSGQFDTKYGPQSDAVAAAARAAGMHVTRAVSPGTAHDWHTVQWALRTQLGPIERQLGLERGRS